MRLSAFPTGGIGARSAREHAPAAYVGTFSACRDLCSATWSAFDPLDLDEGGRLAAAEGGLGASISSGTNVHAESDAPSVGQDRSPPLSPSFFRIQPSPELAVFTLMLAVLPVLALGSRPPRPPRDLHILYSAASACLFGTAMPPAGFAAKFLIGGVTMPFAVADRVLRHNDIRNTVPAPAPILALIFTRGHLVPPGFLRPRCGLELLHLDPPSHLLSFLGFSLCGWGFP